MSFKKISFHQLITAGLCALLLLIWFVVLGYSNPDAAVMRYNKSHGFGHILKG